jgi:Secretion system C-terminal sorting domain
MKTLYPTTLSFISKIAKTTPVLFILSFFLTVAVSAQELSFVSPVLESGNDLKEGSVYRFKNVTKGADALVAVKSFVNGAHLTLIDETGTGYEKAFQPQIYAPAGSGTSYVEFEISFVKENTSTPRAIVDFSATAIDIDGNSQLKEFAEITINGGCSKKFMTATLDIAVTDVFSGYRAFNVSGKEFPGIDETALAGMFSVEKHGVVSYTVKYGAIKTNLCEAVSRQYSLYMKSFNFNTLPVELSGFSVAKKDNGAVINWATATEINNEWFEIERSTDGKEFTTIALLGGNGTTAEKSNYSFTDKLKNVTASVVYYRLKQIDIDGNFTYSSVRTLKLTNENAKAAAINIFPNPVTDHFKLSVNEPVEKDAVINVYDFAGKKVFSQIIANNKGNNFFNVDGLGKLVPGAYTVQLEYNNKTAVQKMIKVK